MTVNSILYSLPGNYFNDLTYISMKRKIPYLIDEFIDIKYKFYVETSQFCCINIQTGTSKSSGYHFMRYLFFK